MGSRTSSIKILPVIFLLALAVPLKHLEAWNRSEIKWRTMRTEHFEVHYHPGEERSARRAGEIAEEIYGPITGFYGYEPKEKVHINISDKEDISSGATYPYLNRIDITATNLDFHLRGSTDWLSNVITHEFTHMISVQSGMKLPRRIPSIYFQAVTFESEKRPDVITGYPNFQASVPISGEIMPHWFAEGLAQYQCSSARNDIWDSHRDMLLRTASINGNLLSMDEMGVFGKNSLESEMVYNQGFSLVRFVADRFGHEKLSELTVSLSSFYRWTFGGAVGRVLGITEDDLYRMWLSALEERYGEVAAGLGNSKREGNKEAGKGFLNMFPVRGQDGRLFYISNRGRDFWDPTLVRKDGEGKIRKIADNVMSPFDITHDGRRLCYAKRTSRNKYGYSINDLYIYDLATGRERRLTRAARATDPAWSPDGGRIACVVGRDGAEGVASVDPGSGAIRILTTEAAGHQYFGLSWGSEGILACRFDGGSRDIVLVDPDSGDERFLVSGPADERDPRWAEDGMGFFYSSDRTGIFNIYYHSFGVGAGSTDSMITNGLGGAFSPAPDGAGCLFSYFGKDGYEIRSIPDWRSGAVPAGSIADDTELMRVRMSYLAGDAGGTVGGKRFEERGSDAQEENGAAPGKPAMDGDLGAAPLEASAGREDAAGGRGGESSPAADDFGISYTKLYMYPRVMIYDSKARLGIFLDSQDILGRQSVFAGGSINADKEFDMQLVFELRQFKPTLRVELYRSRKYYSYFTREFGSDLEYFTRYDLWDVYFTCLFELTTPKLFNRNEIALAYNHGEYGLNIELWELLRQREFRVSVGWNYYRSNEISLLYYYKNVREEIDADVNPRRGRVLGLELTRAYNKLHSGEFAYAFMPVYDRNYFGRYVLRYEEFVPLPLWRHALSVWVMGGLIDSSKIDDFFYLYLGSRDGLRGYSYFSLGGRKMAMARLTYRFPIVRRINRQLAHVYFGSIYAGLFAEAGKAWNEDKFDLRGNKKDVGFEIFLKGFSFYSYPLAVSFEAAYGLNDIFYTDPFFAENIFYEGNNWKFYGSILFNF